MLPSMLGLGTGYLVLDVFLSIVSGIILVLCTTNIVTSLQFKLASGQSRHDGTLEPPVLPYWIPYFGHMFRMASLHELFDDAARMSPHSRPVKLCLGSMKIYLIFGRKNVAELFRQSKYLERDNLTKQAFLNSGRKPDANSSADVKARSIEDIDDEEAVRIGKKLHDLQHRLLSQPADVNAICEKFTMYFRRELRRAMRSPSEYNIHRDGSTMSLSLFKFLKQTMFNASTAALMGESMVRLNPGLADVYWAYDEAFLLGLPELLYPSGSSARDNLLTAIKKYLNSGHANFDWMTSDDVLWEENFGCRLFRTSIKEMKQRDIHLDDQANAILSLVWATASNSVPTTAWMLMALAQDPELASAVERETSAGASSSLLQSLYTETLRLRTSVTVTRKLSADIKLDGYKLSKGHYVMAPSYMSHMSPIFWGGGHDGEQGDETHPKSFYPQRFTTSIKSASPTGVLDNIDQMDQSTSKEANTDRLNIALRTESFFPYGGGNAICPGRFFSKRKILDAVNTFLEEIDIVQIESAVALDGLTKLTIPRNGLNHDTRYAGGGTMPPEGDVIITIKFKHG